MKQTVREKSLPLNKSKWDKLVATAEAFAKQKDALLVRYEHIKYLYALGEKRKLRDSPVACGFVSPYGLQARQWKLALDEALFTLERQWEEAIAEVKEHIQKHDGMSEEKKHYAFWLLYKPGNGSRPWRRVEAVFNDEDITGQKINTVGRSLVRKYLKRTFRLVLGRQPRVGRARSFVVDAQMYRVFRVDDDRQYVAVATLNPGDRMNIPLTGVHAVEGNLRVVLIPQERAVEIHLTRDPLIHPCGKDVAGIDLGVTEVFTDDKGKKYRPEYGDALQKMSGRVMEKGRKRGKLWALRRKLIETDPSKASRIVKHNLGFAKQDKRNGKYRARCENEINRALNEFYKERKPASLAYEDLSHLRGRARSKGLSRKVSNWHRGVVKKRLEYKNHVHSVADPGPQNAAYSSQECPDCGWVDAGNRNGDVFKCRKCSFTADADQVAAINLKRRMEDKEITRHTPYKWVKELLLQRYRDKREAK